MVRALAISDEVDDALVADPTAVRGAQLILACGDLLFEYSGLADERAGRPAGLRAG
jgi:hypothetical protein